MSKNENTNRTELFSIAKKKSAEMLAKSAEVVSGAANKTSVLGKKLAVGVQGTVRDLSEKAKNDRYQKELKKYNPLFPDEFTSESFDIPNIIMIRDDAERRGIEVCEGSIGWREKTKDNVEILYLYDNFVKHSGLHFIPAPECDAVYHVDNFDHTRFIRTDIIFHKSHEERIAELSNVAFCLGAKSCTVDIIESESLVEKVGQKNSYKESADAYGVEASASVNTTQQLSSQGKSSQGGHFSSEWSGNQDVTRPKLKWFRYEETILRLIENRLSGENHVKSEHLSLQGSSSATMSHKAAVAVDAVVGKSKVTSGSSTSTSMEAEAAKENRSKLFFHIEF